MPALGLHGLPPLPDPLVLSQLTTLGLDAQVSQEAFVAAPKCKMHLDTSICD